MWGRFQTEADRQGVGSPAAGPDPSTGRDPMPRLTTAYPLRAIFAKAWCLARHGARRFGGRARQYLAAALRQAWAEAKATAARIAGQTAAVLASIASLPADLAAVDAYMARFYAGQAAARPVAKVVPLPVRPAAPAPVPVSAPVPLRRAA